MQDWLSLLYDRGRHVFHVGIAVLAEKVEDRDASAAFLGCLECWSAT